MASSLAVDLVGSTDHVARSSFGYGETVKELPLPGYTQEQVLGDWFPEALPPP